mgnify:FL=1
MIRKLLINKDKAITPERWGTSPKGWLPWQAMAAVWLLSAGLSGCIADKYDDIEGADGKLIKFTPAVNNTQDNGGTRAATGHPIENGGGIPVNGSFGVYAYSNLGGTVTSYNNELRNNTKVGYDGTDFTYTPVAKWPSQSGAQLAFYGYYPWRDLSNPPATGEPGISINSSQNTFMIDYTTPTDPLKQVDLMYAYTYYTGGFAPVKMTFNHALTRVNFKAKVEDYTQPVKITSIKITNVETHALVLVNGGSQNATATWTGFGNELKDMTLNEDHGLRTDYTKLESSLITMTKPGSATTPGGELLLIPQPVENLEVVVEATLGGANFPEPFVFPLKGTPDWVKNQIVTYEIILSSSGMKLVAKFDNWEDNSVEVIQDGQWWMTVDKDELTFDPLGDTGSIVAETNYNINSQGYSAGLSASVPPEYNWLSIAGASGSDGDLARTFTIKADPVSGTAIRTGEVHITAGNFSKVIKISQNDTFLKIVGDDNATEISELLFCEAAEVTSTKKITVRWTPVSSSVSISNSAQGAEAFPSGAGAPASGTLNDGSGTHTYTIRPAAMTTAELANDPFKERSSLLNFNLIDGTKSVNKSLLLKQLVPTVVFDQRTNFYRLDGSNYSFKVRSNSGWRIKSITGDTNLLSPLNNNLQVGTSGGYETAIGSGTDIYFTATNSITSSGTITVVFECTDPKLPFAEKTLVLTLSGEYYPSMHHGWAGSNIYWDGTKLTFDDVNVTTHQYYQGVFFQWGSLWGIAPNGAHGSAWNNIVYRLNGSSGVHTKTTSAIGWNNNSIPRVDDNSITSHPPTGMNARYRNYLYEITDGATGKGDICKYLTEQAPGKLIHGKKWRMPTSQEFDGSYSFAGNWNYVTSPSDAGGFNMLSNGRVTKAAANGNAATVFPASGYRYGSNGQLNNVGYYGSYWSGSPNGTDGYGLTFLSGRVGPVNYSNRSYGFSVRCVAE